MSLNTLSLNKLKYLIKQDAEERIKQKEKEKERKNDSLQAAVQETTLVQYKSLPRPIQAKLSVSLPADSEQVVEVPKAYLEAPELMADSETNQSTHNRQRRLGGNLTNKLSEYTRGVAGQARPFRPGGLGQEDTALDIMEDSARSEEAIARSQRVLDLGATQELWNDGTLIRAPPGVDFKVGLTWEQVHGISPYKNDDDDASLPVAKDVMDDSQPFAEEPTFSMQQIPPSQISKKLFSKALFDDDSLFASSSEEEEEDSFDEEGKSTGEEPTREEEVTHIDDTHVAVKTNVGGGVEVEDIDSLLLEIAETTDESQRALKKKRHGSNPLELANRQAMDQNDDTRKMWANQAPLPIRDFDALIPNPALVFPFQLDDFQQQAIARLERSESVFVAAHTSAGKTVVAEYAVALARQRGTRCVYTSPIKALSNQKFRDFSLKFGSENVGLVTGDLQVNVDDSTCLIMTTEILRSMLYRGADLIRDIEYVIFDEVHYVNDTERGVVWEEVIIMLPSYVNLIFLSATTPNTVEFSDWIGRTKRKVVHIIKTDYRPVPLSHHLWAGNKLHKVMEGKGSFLDTGYREATLALLPESAKDPKKKDIGKGKTRPPTGSKQLAWQAQGSKQNWMSLVRFLDREALTPTVVFSFSKKKCEEIAWMLQSLDLNTAKERSAIQSFCIQTVSRLSQNDASLPQVITICEMVQRGIGVHHGGLLPILKEMVEILFTRNLIKILFATETFAMGVNCPVRSVVFNGIRKHDGTQFRVLEPGEYTQMAGRAGRRGLDNVGTVIVSCFGEEPPPQPILKQMLTGSSTRLSSQFRLTYNMILNLLRVEEMSVESMIARSFSEFATQRALTANEYPQLLSKGERALSKLEEKYVKESKTRVGAKDLELYFESCSDLLKRNGVVLSYIRETEPSAFVDVLQPGRVLLVTAARQLHCVRAPALILRGAMAPSSNIGLPTSREDSTKLVCMILLPSSYVLQEDETSTSKAKGSIGYVGSSQQRYFMIQEVALENILVVGSGKHKLDTKALFLDDAANRNSLVGTRNVSGFDCGRGDAFFGMAAMTKKSSKDADTTMRSSAMDQAVEKATKILLEQERSEIREGGIQTLDFRNYVKRGNEVMQVRQECDAIEQLVLAIRGTESHTYPNLERYYLDLERLETLRTKVSALKHMLSHESLSLFPDFLQRKAVLQKIGYVDQNDTVCVKGRVACEVNTCESLIVTEMVFEGILNDLEPEEIVAVLSSLVFQEKKDEELDAELPERLVQVIDQVKIIATNLGKLQKEKGLDVDPLDYCENNLRFGLVHVVYEWALGVPFKNICDLTDVQEGSIVRCITRLDELCREVRNCARVVGNPTLYRKLEAASVAIKRDIVFASSLYVS